MGHVPTRIQTPVRVPARAWLVPVLGALLVGAVVVVLGRVVVLGSAGLQSWDQDVVDRAVGLTRDHPPMGAALLVWQAVSRPWVLQMGLVLTCIAVALHAAGDDGRRVPTGGGDSADPDPRLVPRQRAAFVAVITLTGWAVSGLAKLVVDRHRPVVADPVTVLSGLSFPSGHATSVSLTAALFLVLLWPWLGHRWRVAATTGAVVVVVITCADRILLGVHYPTDVIGGMVLGLGVAAGAYAAWRPQVRIQRARTKQ